MKRTTPENILILSLVLWITIMLKAWTEDPNPVSGYPVYNLDEVVITATRTQTLRQNVSSNIIVVSREDIENTPAVNVAEILQHTPGLYVEFNGGLGSPAVANIQGSDFRHVTVFQDGIPLNQLAHPLTNLSYLPIDAIERIEVYKGAASSTWGSALGGVINIITREPNENQFCQADLRAMYGEDQTLKSRGSFSGTVNRWRYLVSMSHDESDGFIEHSAYKQDAVYAKMNYQLGDTSRINFVYSYDEGRVEEPLTNLFPDIDVFWDDNYQKRTYQRLLFETHPSDDVLITLEGRYHRFYNVIEDVYSDSRETFNDYWDHRYGISTRIQWMASQTQILTAGFDEDWGRYNWHDYNRIYETRNAALYVNDTLSVGAFSFNAGLRYDDNSDFDATLSPSLGMVYRFWDEKAIVRGHLARGFSAPPPAWIHDPTYGNPDLKPEIGINIQFGGEVRLFSPLLLELNFFKSDIQDLIQFKWDEYPVSGRFENIGKVNRSGVEGNIRLTFDFGLTLSAGGSFVDIKNDVTDEEIRDIPRTLYHVTAYYVNRWMSHGIYGKYIHHNSTDPNTRDRVFVFDYLIALKLPLPETYGVSTFYGAIYNLTDATYLYHEYWPQPGRKFEGGIRFVF